VCKRNIDNAKLRFYIKDALKLVGVINAIITTYIKGLNPGGGMK
jgi:hypothetical protein